MTWGPDEREIWTTEVAAAAVGVPEPLRMLQRVLLRLPRRREQTVGDIGCGSGPLLPFLAWHFGRVVAVDPSAEQVAAARDRCDGLTVEFRRGALDDPAAISAGLDVAVALDSIATDPAGMTAVLGAVRAALVEGGLLLATFPAFPRGGAPYAMRLADAPLDPRGLHEIELQYRLRRAGFPGLRIRRLVGAAADGGDTLVVLACRRAPN